jgi:hypothetical protein
MQFSFLEMDFKYKDAHDVDDFKIVKTGSWQFK